MYDRKFLLLSDHKRFSLFAVSGSKRGDVREARSFTYSSVLDQVLGQKQASFSLNLGEWTPSSKSFLGISIVCSEEIPILKNRRLELLEST